MAHNVALVLGGGGAAGNAWEIGVIAGLADAGVDLTEAADLVIGTSAGATAAAQVRSGIPASELLASVLAAPRPQPAGHNREQPPSLPMATVFDRMRAIGAAATSAADVQRAMGAFGLESDSILDPGAAQRRAVVAARLPHAAWPDRPMLVTAIEAQTGELVAFDRDSGVELVDAVTASTALPGLVPTVSINGAISTVACAPPTTPTLRRAMRTSWCCRRWADGLAHRRKASSRACAGRRNGAWTWQARSKACASRAATSR
jgi:NTE family protein